MLRFLATMFPYVAHIREDRDWWMATAQDRKDEITTLKDDLAATRKARDEQTAALAKSRELHEAASTRAVRAESEAAYYRGIVGNVRRAMGHDHRAVVEASEARVHPEQRAVQMGKIGPWDDEAKAQYDAKARAVLR